jgi:hypothetical protein
LIKYLSEFKCKETRINAKRKEILERCWDISKKSVDIYTLTVPTGGGKTYSSLAFALNHAKINKLEKIIYVIPYTSINVEDIQSINEKLKLASENWDIPIIVTTNVQFFESLFSNRSSRCRKIHNMAKSVLIFDEAQMLPIQYLKPCLLAIAELVKNYGSTAAGCLFRWNTSMGSRNRMIGIWFSFALKRFASRKCSRYPLRKGLCSMVRPGAASRWPLMRSCGSGWEIWQAGCMSYFKKGSRRRNSTNRHVRVVRWWRSVCRRGGGLSQGIWRRGETRVKKKPNPTRPRWPGAPSLGWFCKLISRGKGELKARMICVRGSRCSR